MSRIYLDHAATTPLLPAAFDAMRPWLSQEYGNPSSLHAEGRRAKDAIDEAREVVSSALGSLFAEVLFTSGGTEAANMAILGVSLNNSDPRRTRVILGAAEHHCVLHTRETLERLGYRVDLAGVDRIGRVDLDSLEDSLGDDVLLVSSMHANNELGTIQPAREVADLAPRWGALYHCDAVQTFLNPVGGSQWKVADLDADVLTISAHKVNGPKGTGAIYIRAGVKLKPLVSGGGQEREMRGGTENTAGIVGFAEAVRLRAKDKISGKAEARDRFLECLDLNGVVLSAPDRRETLAGHLHLRCPGIDAETMLILLDRMGVSASSGAACSSGSIEPSHVLIACGYSPEESKEGLRFTFGWDTRQDEAEEAAGRVNEAKSQILTTRAKQG